MSALDGIRVLDRTAGIAGPYCTKLLADAGAEVVKVEPIGGDPMRGYRSGALFEYLNTSKRSVTSGFEELLTAADVLITDRSDDARSAHRDHPGLVVVSITPFGLNGPWSDRPATEFTMQAACGSTGGRGDPEDPPLAAGGRVGEWIAGTYAAVAALAALRLDQSGRSGRLVDVAVLDCMAVTLVTFPSVFASFAGWPPLEGTARVLEVPSIEPVEDGFVVFTTNSRQQFEDFVVMIGRPDWMEEELANPVKRFARRHEFLDAVHKYSQARRSREVLEEAGLFRIPAGPVLDGSTVADFEHFVARQIYVRSPSGRFRQPRPPYRIGRTEPRTFQSAPSLGEDNGRVQWPSSPARAERPARSSRLPLGGVKVLDCTGWWAGPSATHVLACLGADVVKVESETRPDPMRTASTRPPSDTQWLEWSPIFHAVNMSKRAVTIDLSIPEGVATFERLAEDADVVVENYTPRVMDQFGLGWERLKDLNPRLIMVRMPAFGLDGPWRDRTGFAQTMESISGMAWITGFPDKSPVLVRGACDPLAGMHAVIATLLALRARDGDGEGRLVEAAMVESALNITAEQVIEWDVHGVRLDRQGNRGPGAPQGVFPCTGSDRWVAIAVETDGQWEALRVVAGLPDDPRWRNADARREGADEVEALIASWSSSQDQEAAVEVLVQVGVPAAAVVRGRDIVRNPQLQHRRLFEVEEHPVTGRHELPTLPFRFSDVDGWLSAPAPTLGQHNEEILGQRAGRA